MKSFIFLIIFIGLFKLAKPQTVVSGRITSTNKTGVSQLSVLAHPKGNSGTIISYAFTDEKGAFKLEIESKEDSLGISVKSLTHRDTTVYIANRTQMLNFVLPVQNHEIKEVNVNAHAISRKKDTITYLVSKFAQVKDQSIGDVISKMPGFEVTTEGQVLYQGNPIQKYYIEGMDLLENRYSIANKNLPFKDVGAVEVLENHQPIKALEKKVFSNGTSINLKLKRNIAATGTMQLGAGLPVLLRQVNATPMLFTPKQQMVTTFQSNNIGDDLNQQNQPMQFSQGQLEGLGSLKTNLVGIAGIPPPQIDRKRYLNNDANLLSYNHLLKINQLTELKITSSFYHDHQKENGEIKSTYHLSDGSYELKEQTGNHYYNTSLSTGFTLTQNVEKKYLKEQLIFNRFWDYERGIITNPNIQKSKAETPAASYSNTFDLLLPVGNHFFRIYSAVSYTNEPQKIYFQPGVFPYYLNQGSGYSETVQNYKMNEFSGKQFMRFTLVHKLWSFDTEPGFNFEFQNYRTSITKDQVTLDADSLNNNYEWTNIELYLTERVNFKKENFRFGISSPFRALFYKTNDQIHQSIAQNQRLLVSPNVWVDYDFWRFWSIDGSIGYNSRLGDAAQLAQGYIIQDYRQMRRYSDKLNNRQIYSGNMGLEYKNPIVGFFSAFSWSHNQTIRSLLNRAVYAGDGLFLYDAIKTNNKLIANSISLNNSWVSSNQKFNLSLKCQFSDTRYEYLLNKTRGWLHNQFLQIQPTIGINCLKNIGIDYNVKFSQTKQWNVQSSNVILGQVHKFDFYYYPSSKHWLGANLEYYNYGKQLAVGNNGLFANLGYTYKPANSRLEYRLRCNNLFNSRQVIDYFYSDISITESHYSIRPREIILMVSFSLSRGKNK